MEVELPLWLAQRCWEMQNDRLTLGRRRQLDAMDPTWMEGEAVANHYSRQFDSDSWEFGYQQAEAFYKKFGHLRVDITCRGNNGYRLASWLSKQRVLRASGDLTDEQIARLDAIGMIWGQYHTQKKQRFVRFTEAVRRRWVAIRTLFLHNRRIVRR